MNRCVRRVGLDVGSTTLKIVSVDAMGAPEITLYRRHNAEVIPTLMDALADLGSELSRDDIQIAITGSAGMGISERTHLPFVQEVIAACRVAEQRYPEARCMVDIGGEDAKMIFFEPNRAPDIRMNGSCAGGTGAFIDQMAVLLGVPVEELAVLAERATQVHPIASRCGVFSKTDIQNLLARGARREDIAASIFHAVSLQVLTTLSRGYTLSPAVLLCGGPFNYIPPLRKAFAQASGLPEEAFILPQTANAIPAWGAALSIDSTQRAIPYGELLDLLRRSEHRANDDRRSSLPPLFNSEQEHEAWLASKQKYRLPTNTLASGARKPCFLGIDSGSTTTKVVLLNSSKEIIFRDYRQNAGDPLHAVTQALQRLIDQAAAENLSLTIGASCVTGYGEDLVQKAFGLTTGMVETIAHYSGAKFFDPHVSFILDIGGQDMKAAFISNGTISKLEINEACSSGCGSFIETFATSLGQTVQDFARAACSASYPSDLGTRCTVFMNSRVKQSLREGASQPDISAGLGYAVVRNCLHKVLKIKNLAVLGNRIMVQGGTFRNPAVCRAFEIETGRSVIITDAPELMGAFGAALEARRYFREHGVAPRPLNEVARLASHVQDQLVCSGCHNHCQVTTFRFENGKEYFAGNKCEKVYSNRGQARAQGVNLSEFKYKLTFNPNFLRSRIGEGAEPSERGHGDPVLTLGIPRVLGMYEHYPFWQTFFTTLGFRVRLSAPSSMPLAERGAHTVMSDNICFPAKLAHGHILNLLEADVDRIFFPFVVYERNQVQNADNSYNCPIVSGYSEVIRSTLGSSTSGRNVPVDAPTISFRDRDLLLRQCKAYVREIAPSGRRLRTTVKEALNHALGIQHHWERILIRENEALAARAMQEGSLVIMLAARPYHTDPLIQHKVSQLISEFGAHVLTEDMLREGVLDKSQSETVFQWAYTNRIVAAATWVAEAPANVHYVQLTSFGCGPDAYVVDEATQILQRVGKTATMLKVDEVSNVGSLRLRIRSLIESLSNLTPAHHRAPEKVRLQPPFREEDRHRTILMPHFGDMYSHYLPPLFKIAGYRAENLPPSADVSNLLGLRYANNEICYPATLIVGDFVHAMQSGRYDPSQVAFGLTQTGGQCRATNYMGLVKRALANAGYNDIPIISVAVGKGKHNQQPGFSIPWAKLLIPVVRTLVYADILAVLFNTARVREKSPGQARSLYDTYTQRGMEALESGSTRTMHSLLRQAALAFGAIVQRKEVPRIGIVGEIFVKYNSFANRGVVDWLVDHGIEPVIPALTEFFLEALASKPVRVAHSVDRRDLTTTFVPVLEQTLFRMIRGLEAEVEAYPYYRPIAKPSHDARLAAPIINLNAQFGEGWLIPASFARFASEDITSIVCLQPFGCIANHVVAKGIEKRTKALYPELSILFLDLDSGVSDVNFYNRLHFIAENAKASLARRQGTELRLAAAAN